MSNTTIRATLLGLSTFVTAGLFVITMAGVNAGLTKVEPNSESSNASAHYTPDGEEIVVQTARL